MKIGIFTDCYTPLPNGVATSVEIIAHALEKRGHKVAVIAPKVPGHQDKKENIYRLTSIRFLTDDVRLALQLPERAMFKAMKNNFDVIHAYNGGTVSLSGWEIARARDIPYVFTYFTFFNKYTHYFFRGNLISPKAMEMLGSLSVNRCDYVIAPTDKVKKELIDYGIKKQIHIVPMGVKTENYHHSPRGFLRKKFPIAKDQKILLFVGRLGKEKSVDFLLETFKQVLKTNPNVALVIVGDGVEKKSLQKQARELDIDKNTYFLGKISHTEVPKVYADADLFVFASQTETQGMVIYEALASALPIVAVADTAFAKCIKNGKNGYLVPKNKQIFAKKVLTLLEDPALYKTFSENSLKIGDQFSIDATAERLEKVYFDLIKKKELKGISYKRKYFYKFKNLVKKPLVAMRNG